MSSDIKINRQIRPIVIECGSGRTVARDCFGNITLNAGVHDTSRVTLPLTIIDAVIAALEAIKKEPS